MMRSMFSGVSSLRVHQTKMDVIANNIANVNTDGFKSQRATFADAFYQNLQGASGPNPDFGRSGTNPRQIGLGLNLASIDNLMHTGIARRTDNALDVAIEGGGFFILRDRGGANVFTRTGRIERDAHWNLHVGGNMLMGWGTVADPTVPGGHAVDRGLLVPLSLSGDKQNMPSEPTTMIDLDGNLSTEHLSYDARLDIHYKIVPKTIYDSLGNPYLVNMRMIYHREFTEGSSGAGESPYGYWTMEVMTSEYDPATGRPPLPGEEPEGGGEWPRGVLAYLNGNRNNPSIIGICMMDGAGVPASPSIDQFRDNMVTAVTIAFNSNGDMIGIGTADTSGAYPQPQRFLATAREDEFGDPTTAHWVRGNQFDFKIVPITGVAPSATFGDTQNTVSRHDPDSTPPNAVRIAIGTLAMNFEQLGQRADDMSARSLTKNGGGPGTLEDITVGPDGTIMGLYSNGRDRILGQIPLAFFSNPAGLQRIGNSLWRATANSGPFDGVGLIGQMIGGALEGSNVDLANEFTEMITTQRGFQAASRTITTSDEMLQELVNLKR